MPETAYLNNYCLKLLNLAFLITLRTFYIPPPPKKKLVTEVFYKLMDYMYLKIYIAYPLKKYFFKDKLKSISD